MSSPSILIVPSPCDTSPSKVPCTESYLNRWARVRVSVRSFTATKSMSATPCSLAALTTCRPILPKPLMPTRIAIHLSSLRHIARCASTPECDVRNDARATLVQSFRACVKCGDGGYYVVHQHHVSSGQIPATNNSRERAGHVSQAIAWCEAGLRLRRATPDECFDHSNIPVRPKQSSQKLALVVAALSSPRGCERHRNQHVAFFHDIHRKVKPCHLFCHWRGQSCPARVLELVDNLASRAARDPADRSDGSDESGK